MPNPTVQDIYNDNYRNPFRQPQIYLKKDQLTNVSFELSADQFPNNNNIGTYFGNYNNVVSNIHILPTTQGIDNISIQSATYQNDNAINFLDSCTVFVHGMNDLRNSNTLSLNNHAFTRMLLGTILPYAIPSQYIQYGKDTYKGGPGNWTDKNENQTPIGNSTFTVTQNDYLEFDCTEGEARYIAIQFIVFENETINWTISVGSINGQNFSDKISFVDTGLTKSGPAGPYVTGLVFDTGNTQPKKIRITNKAATSTQEKYVSFVASWNGVDENLAKNVLLVDPPLSNWQYFQAGGAGIGGAGIDKFLNISNSMIDVANCLRSHGLNVSYYRIQSNGNAYEANQLTLSNLAQQRFARELTKYAITFFE
jgi:hypothetical protein